MTFGAINKNLLRKDKIIMLYVLKGDILEYDYQVFGVYSNLNNLLINATKIVKQDISIAENAQKDYDFSGLVYYLS